MKTVYINENMFSNDEFKKGVLMDVLPDIIVSKILRNKTSLGNNPSIPDIFDEPFLLRMAENGFKDCKNKLKSIGEITEVNETELEPALAKLIQKCIEIETPYRAELEKACLNYVIDLFEIPDETVDITMSLSDSVDTSKVSAAVDPSKDTTEYNSVDDAMNIKGEIYKRRLLNVLCVGAAMRLSENYSFFENEINKINPELTNLYNKITSLNNYLLYTKDDFGITDKTKMQIGIVEVSLTNEDNKPKIDAQGVIFPILLMETIKGFMELFISHGLPSDLNIATSIIGKTDFLKAEPWDMKFGPLLWDLFSDSFNDIGTIELPYLIKRVSKLPVDKFNFLMKEVFAKTKKGKELMTNISHKSKKDIEYDKFVDKMAKMKQDKGIITDDYIKPDEL